jgi:hypothetical protein
VSLSRRKRIHPSVDPPTYVDDAAIVVALAEHIRQAV